MKLIKPYGFIVAAACVSVFLFFCIWKTDDQYVEAGSFTTFNDLWTVTADGTDSFYSELPSSLDSSKEGIVYTKTLPSGIAKSVHLAFYTSNQDVTVYLDGVEIYESTQADYPIGNGTGKQWHFVPVYSAYVGRQLSIYIKDNYNRKRVAVPKFYLGDKEMMAGSFTKNNLHVLFVSALLFLIGVVLMAGYVYIKRTTYLAKGILWLGITSFMASIWSLMETQVLSLYMNDGYIFSLISYLSQKLITVPLLCFICFVYERKRDRIAEVLCYISMADVVVSTILQLMDVVDYRTTMLFTHLLSAVMAVYVLYLTVNYWKDKEKMQRAGRNFLKVNSLCMLVVACCILCDEVSYYAWPDVDSARFSRVGLMLYIVIMMCMLVAKSIHLIQMGEKAEQIKEESMQDPLTKLLNRAAYEAEINRLIELRQKNCGIAMFDLNNLKKFNDGYGHSMGDAYIIVSSEILVDVFGMKGQVYRVGGDEFAAILKDVSEQQFEILEHMMSEKVNSLSEKYFYGKMQIASGYAAYDQEKDIVLLDTMKRADVRMYEKKALLKEKKVFPSEKAGEA